MGKGRIRDKQNRKRKKCDENEHAKIRPTLVGIRIKIEIFGVLLTFKGVFLQGRGVVEERKPFPKFR